MSQINVLFRLNREKYTLRNQGRYPLTSDPPASTIISKSQARQLKSNSEKVSNENGKTVWQSKERMKVIHITELKDQDPVVKIVNRFIRFTLDEKGSIQHMEPPADLMIG